MVRAAAEQGDFRPGSAVMMSLQGYYSVASATTGRLSLRISDPSHTIATSSSMTVAKGGDFFLLSATFLVPQESTEVCCTALLEVGPITIAGRHPMRPGYGVFLSNVISRRLSALSTLRHHRLCRLWSDRAIYDVALRLVNLKTAAAGSHGPRTTHFPRVLSFRAVRRVHRRDDPSVARSCVAGDHPRREAGRRGHGFDPSVQVPWSAGMNVAGMFSVYARTVDVSRKVTGVSGAAIADDIPTRLVLPVVVASGERQAILGPDYLGADGQPGLLEGRLHHARLRRPA